jgi:hypothetical protein
MPLHVTHLYTFPFLATNNSTMVAVRISEVGATLTVESLKLVW